MTWLARTFKLEEHQTDVRTEVLAGLTTFLTMAYIIFVNPNILADAGMPHDAVFVATCIAAAIGTIIMGMYANYPIAMAPGMGLNAYFAYAVVKGMGFTWQAALGAVFISGCLFLLVSVFRIREMIVNGIPHSIRVAITAGIGLFLGIVSLRGAGLIVGNPATLVTLGNVHQPSVILAVIGFFVIVALDHLRVKGAILIGILSVTAASFFFAGNTFHGVVSMPPSLAPTLMQLDIMGALSVGILNVVLVFFLVELFDATGTLMGVANRAGLLKQGKMDRLNKALLADSTAIMAGSLLGTSSTTAYIESASGVQAGGRTGLTALTVAALFLLPAALLVGAPLGFLQAGAQITDRAQALDPILEVRFGVGIPNRSALPIVGTLIDVEHRQGDLAVLNVVADRLADLGQWNLWTLAPYARSASWTKTRCPNRPVPCC
ncbi:NCS2 family permease [Ralstonia sp.]|uniref:NCS2 family permease n=1 Tax=Ralstonia sp. TaxID=54061 RepID=UPI0025F1821C|nr:NCS2 family permease [Ralstonia sp.]